MKHKLDNYKTIKLGYTFKDDYPWVLLEDIELKLSNGDIALLPKGFSTDFASVPERLWGLFPPYGHDILAFIIHDYLWNIGGYLTPNKEFINVSNRFTDNEMMWQQKKVGVSPFRYIPMYLGVKLNRLYQKLAV